MGASGNSQVFRLITIFSLAPTDTARLDDFLRRSLSERRHFEFVTTSSMDKLDERVQETTILKPKIEGIQIKSDGTSVSFNPKGEIEKINLWIIDSADRLPALVLEATIKSTIEEVAIWEEFFFDRDNQILVDGKKVLEHLENEFYRDTHLAESRHQILILESEVPTPVIEQLMIKGPREINDSSLKIKSIDELASIKQTKVLVWDSNTITWGWNADPEFGENRIRQMIFAAATTVTGEAALKIVRHQTVELINEISRRSADIEGMKYSAYKDRARIVEFENKLMTLRLHIAFASDWPRSPDLIRGGRPLEAYQIALYDEISLPTSLEITINMQDRLGGMLESMRNGLETRMLIENSESTNMLLAKTDAIQATSIVVASVLAAVSIGTLFAALASIPHDGLITPAVRNISIAGLIVFCSALLGYVIHRATKTKKRAKTKRGALGYSLAGISAFGALVFSLFIKSTPKILTIEVIGLSLVIIVVLLVARYTDFDFHPNEKNPNP